MSFGVQPYMNVESSRGGLQNHWRHVRIRACDPLLTESLGQQCSRLLPFIHLQVVAEVAIVHWRCNQCRHFNVGAGPLRRERLSPSVTSAAGRKRALGTNTKTWSRKYFSYDMSMSPSSLFDKRRSYVVFVACQVAQAAFNTTTTFEDIHCGSQSDDFKALLFNRCNWGPLLRSGCRTIGTVSERGISSNTSGWYSQGRKIQYPTQTGLGRLRNGLACKRFNVSIRWGWAPMWEPAKWLRLINWTDSTAIMLPSKYWLLNCSMMTTRFKFSIACRKGRPAIPGRNILFSS